MSHAKVGIRMVVCVMFCHVLMLFAVHDSMTAFVCCCQVQVACKVRKTVVVFVVRGSVWNPKKIREIIVIAIICVLSILVQLLGMLRRSEESSDR